MTIEIPGLALASMPPALAGGLADALLGLHVMVVAFVVLGTLAILVGARRDWRWIRRFDFRLTHLGLLVFIALQAWLGRLCPLTLWEQTLRIRAGQTTYDTSFIQHWLSRLIFFEAPWWMFVAAYTGLASLVGWCWWRWPPRRAKSRAMP